MRRWSWLVDALLVLGCAAVASLLEQDANWDQLQHHYWYPWQLLNGGFDDPDLYGGRFLNPLAQTPFFLLVSALPPVWAQAALGGLAGIAAVITRRIAVRALPFEGGWAVVVSTCAALLAVAGAAFRSEVGTSFSDVLLASLLLGGLLLILREQPLLAGLLAGAAVGLKYTSLPFAVSAALAVAVVRWQGLGRWALGGLAGWALTGGAWAWHLWRTYESPVFPFWNSIFGSPWYPDSNLTDERYGVAGWREWAWWPWDMATGSAPVLDLPVRDPRWVLLAVALVLLLLGLRRLNRAAWAVMAFTVAGLVLWLAVFGVIRYAIPAEMTAAVLIVVAVAVWTGPRTTVIISLLLVVVAGLLTTSAATRRVPFGDRWFVVEPGGFAQVRAGDVVLVDGQFPSTFLLPGNVPEGVPVHVVQKDYTGTPLQQWLEREIAAAQRVWVVTKGPPSQVDPAVGTIDYDNCTRIRSNVVDRWLCPLK